MGQTRNVTSVAIQRVINEISEDVIPAVKHWDALVDTTHVAFPGWGALGEVMVGLRYRNLQDDVQEKFSQAISVLEDWNVKLDTARTNWRTAEDRSVVVYV